jgi:ABC-type transport system involved in multi-copper enzyme maturation permease subunit
MLRLLNIEIQKLRASMLFKVFILSYFIILSCIALVASVEIEFLGLKIDFSKQGLFDTPLLWHMNVYVAAMLKWFLAIIIVSSMVSEYQYGTLKQNLIDGLSKKEFILSKIYTIIASVLISCVFIVVVSIMMHAKATDGNALFTGFEYVGAYFLRITLFLMFAFFVAVLIKRSAFTFFIIFLWWILESITRVEKFGLSMISDYLPLRVAERLIHEPFTRMTFLKQTTDMMTEGKGLGYDYSVQIDAVILSTIYIVVFGFASYWIVKKRDL